MTYTTCAAAWDALVAEVAREGLVIEPTSDIESRALGMALTGGGIARRWEIVRAEGPVSA